MIKKLLVLLLTYFFAINVFAQKASPDFESRYATAKKLLDQEKFGLAMQSYKTLLAGTEKNDLVPYAQFYLGDAAYRDGSVSYAKDVFLQLSIKHPDWSNMDAAYLWLSRIGFEQSGPFKGMLYAVKIESEPYLNKSDKYIKYIVNSCGI